MGSLFHNHGSRPLTKAALPEERKEGEPLPATGNHRSRREPSRPGTVPVGFAQPFPAGTPHGPATR